MKASTIFLTVALVFAWIGCATPNPLLQRASFDLSCPEGDLSAEDLGGGVQGVKGCGKHATYVMDDHGRWIANTPGITAKKPPQ